MSSNLEQGYIDFGSSFGSHIWSFIDWSKTTPQINESQMDAYLTSLFAQMKAAGMGKIDLAFAQLDNIQAYLNGDYTGNVDSTNDVIAQLLNMLKKSNVQVGDSKDFLKYFIDQAHKNGMTVSLSFGGANGTDKSSKILQGPSDTYAGQAEKLAEAMKAYGIDSVDFDIEDPTFISSQKADSSGGTLIDFFKTLHDQLSKEGKTVTLTSSGGIADWPKGAVKALFFDAQGNSIFSKLFDELNLMDYSDTQYYIDANNPTWGIEQWIDIIGKENASRINIGFDDGVPYESPNASAGGKYNIRPGSTRGQAAAQIYQQLLEQLKKDGYPSKLGTPFFWPANDVNPNGKNRYDTTGDKSNFVSQTMQDFYNALHTQKKTRPILDKA